MTFGRPFSRALLEGLTLLAPYGVGVRWILAVVAYESGFNPKASNPSGARGLFQKMPARLAKVKDNPKGTGLPMQCYQSAGWWVLPYLETDPAVQIRDACAFWLGQIHAFKYDRIRSRAAFYCLNLAPARAGGRVLYARVGAEAAMGPELVEEIRRATWQAGYDQNSQLDLNHNGVIEVEELDPILEKAEASNLTRIDAEVEAMVAEFGQEPP